MINKRWIGIFVLGLVANLLFLFVFFIPSYSKLNRFKNATISKSGEKEKAGEKMELASELYNSLKTARQELAQYEKYIPDTSNELRILQTIEEICKNSGGIKVVSIKTIDSSRGQVDNLRVQPCRIIIEGRYEGIAKLLYSLTNMKNIADISELSIKQPHEGKTLSAAIVIECYYADTAALSINSENRIQ